MEEGQVNDPLPSFERPPVSEVALSVGFDPMVKLRVVDIYDFYGQKYGSERFPTIEEKPPYIIPVERFGIRARIPDVKIELLDRPSPLRHWFVSQGGTEIVQVQTDWFARNWRKSDGNITYPRYPSIRDPFERDLSDFATFLKDRGIGILSPTQCEVTYVNQIHRDDVWSTHGDVAKVMRYWQTWSDGEFSPRPEQVQFSVSYLMPDTDDPIGRLHVSLQPAFTVDSGEPIFVVNLTARGSAVGSGIEGAMRFLDMGHDWIVRCFADVTTDEMHHLWERNV